ncbi:MAG: DUF3575 domain-containing protein [Bacteroidota bacterium]
MRNALILLLGLFASTATFAQVDVKINPIGTIFGNPNLSVEFAASQKFGVEATVGPNFGSIGIDDTRVNRRGFTGNLIGKYYLNEDVGTDNLSIGLYLKGRNINFTAEDNEEDKASRNKIALGFAVGQKWVSKNNIIFSIDGGVGRNIINRFEYDNEEENSFNLNNIPLINIDLFFRLSVGYRF